MLNTGFVHGQQHLEVNHRGCQVQAYSWSRSTIGLVEIYRVCKVQAPPAHTAGKQITESTRRCNLQLQVASSGTCMSCWVMCMKPCSPMCTKLVHAVAINAPDLLPANPALQDRLTFCTDALTQAVMTCPHLTGTSTDLQAASNTSCTLLEGRQKRRSQSPRWYCI